MMVTTAQFLIAIAAAVTLMQVIPGARSVPSACGNDACNCTAELFKSPGLQGRKLEVQDQNADLDNDDFDNTAYSVRIIGDCEWLFYNCTDFCCFDAVYGPGVAGPGTRYYPIATPKLSSLRALPTNGTIAIALFDEENFEGRMEVLCSVESDLANRDFDDKARSAIAIRGNWKLHEDTGFQGTQFAVNAGQRVPSLPTYIGVSSATC